MLSALAASQYARRTHVLCGSLARHRRGAHNADNTQNHCHKMHSPNARTRLWQCTRHAIRVCIRKEMLQLIKFSQNNKRTNGWLIIRAVCAHVELRRALDLMRAHMLARKRKASIARAKRNLPTAMQNVCINHIGRADQCKWNAH